MGGVSGVPPAVPATQKKFVAMSRFEGRKRHRPGRNRVRDNLLLTTDFDQSCRDGSVTQEVSLGVSACENLLIFFKDESSTTGMEPPWRQASLRLGRD